MRELAKLPHDLGKMPSIVEVRKLYEKSFFQIRRCPKPKTNEMEENFTKILDDIMTSHNAGDHAPPPPPPVANASDYCARSRASFRQTGGLFHGAHAQPCFPCLSRGEMIARRGST